MMVRKIKEKGYIIEVMVRKIRMKGLVWNKRLKGKIELGMKELSDVFGINEIIM